MFGDLTTKYPCSLGELYSDIGGQLRGRPDRVRPLKGDPLTYPYPAELSRPIVLHRGGMDSYVWHSRTQWLPGFLPTPDIFPFPLLLHFIRKC